jgi:hypothetical protein
MLSKGITNIAWFAFKDGKLDWRRLQSLVRTMPNVRKTLILANLVMRDGDWQVNEVSMTTEHAPFRHRKNTIMTNVGTQIKRRKVDEKMKVEDTMNPNTDMANAVKQATA